MDRIASIPLTPLLLPLLVLTAERDKRRSQSLELKNQILVSVSAANSYSAFASLCIGTPCCSLLRLSFVSLRPSHLLLRSFLFQILEQISLSLCPREPLSCLPCLASSPARPVLLLILRSLSFAVVLPSNWMEDVLHHGIEVRSLAIARSCPSSLSPSVLLSCARS